ncbi:hypothetical protein MYP_2087 [Sporocytophaga myxococcoides]|uniref:Uncharacterized protein n=1 Tax=Sporocytophaga myxococcoides TaxID=153721 RepID=A0A098LEL9_9BACT|nr:hypothetical protein MYP_2087 [Sporocytophaga myxococcoides]
MKGFCKVALSSIRPGCQLNSLTPSKKIEDNSFTGCKSAASPRLKGPMPMPIKLYIVDSFFMIVLKVWMLKVVYQN